MSGKRSLKVSVYLRPAQDVAPPVEWSALEDAERKRLLDQILQRAAEALLNCRMRMSNDLQRDSGVDDVRRAD